MTEAQRDSFVEDKLTCEKHLELPERLLNAVRKVLAEKDLNSLLQIVADASRDLTGARYITTGHGYVNGVFIAGGSSRSVGAKPCPTGKEFNVEKGGVYLSLIREKESIRLTDAEMRSHPAWWGLPEDHVPLRGLLGVRLIDVNGLPNGLIMASDKENGGDFTAEDETILSQLAAMVSLALQHIEARMEAENEKLRLEAVMEALPVGMAVTDVNGGQIKSNSAFEKIWGVQRPPVRSIGDYAAYKAWWADTGKLVEPDEWASVQAVKTGKPAVEQVMEIQQFDGTRRFIINSGAPIRDASNNIVGSSVAIQDITERKRAEEALSQSEARYRVLVETSPDAVVVHKDGRLLYANSAALRLYGAETFEQLQERNILDLLHPDDREQITARVRHVIEGGKTPLRESRIIKLDGTQVSVEATGGPIDYQGERAVQAIIRDITERKQAEEALNKSERQLKHIIENSLDVAYRRDLLTDRFDYISPSIENITGFTVAEMMSISSDDMVDRVHPDDLDIVYKKFEMIQKGGRCAIEYRFRCKDDQYRWIADSTNALVDSNGNPNYRMGVVRDITERKKAEESEERLKVLMDHDPSLVFLKDESGRYVYLNKAYERQFALSKDWYGKNDFDFWPKESAELFRKNDLEVLRSKQIHKFLEDSTDLEGKRHCWLNYKFPFIDSNNERYVGGIGIDVTDRIITEEALKASEERYRGLFNSMTEGFALHEIICDEKGKPIDYRFLDINPGFEQLTGLNKADVIGRTHNEVLPDDDPRWVREYGTVALTGNPVQLDNYSPALKRHYEVFAYCPAPGKFATVFMDITERKKAEEALSRNEALLRAVLDTSVDPIYLKDRNGRVLLANPATLAVVGKPAEAVLGKTDVEFYDNPGTGRTIMETDQRIMNSGQIEVVEESVSGPAGTRIYLSTKTPYKDAQGNVIGLVGVSHEITEQKRIEVALRESEERYRGVVENTTAIILRVSPAGIINFANQRALDFYGYSAEELIGKHAVGTIIPVRESSGRDLAKMVDQIAADPDAFHTNANENICKDGHRVWMEWTNSGIYGPDGQLKGFLSVGIDATARKQAEEALRENEERLRSLAENVPCVLMRFDRQLRVVYLSKQSDRYNPNPVEQMIGRTNREMGMPEHLCNLWDAAIERVFHTGNQEEMEFELLGPSGMRTFALRFAPEFGPDHEVQYVLGVSSDITDRKQAEEAVRQSEERLSLAISAGRLATWDWRITTDEVIWNDEHFRMLGYKPGEANPSYQAWIERVHPDDRSNAEAIFGRSLKVDGDYINEFRSLWPDGTVRWLEARGHSDQDSKGQPLRSFGVMIDITERKEAEEQLINAKELLEQKVQERTADLQKAYVILEEQEAKYRRLTEMSPDAILVSIDDRIAFANNAAAKMLGASNPDDLIGKNSMEFIHPDYREIVKVRRNALSEGTTVNPRLEQKTIGLDGRVIDTETVSARIMYDSQPARIIVGRDITARKVVEAELRQAKEKAEAAVEAKASFLANMSHEIRTPMNAIIGMTELILDEPMDPVQRENLQLVRTNGDALLSIINDILDFSKMESDKLILEEYEFDLRSCVEEALDLVALKAADKGLNLAYTIDKNVPENIIGDPGRLRQILGNLLSNAVKFTDKGEATISVSSDGTNEIHFAVQDTGIGIPQGSMHQLFQPFNQMEPSTTRLYGGTGLGLAISRKLVELMDGRIWAESEKGKGSIFNFTIKAPSGKPQPQTTAVLPQMIGRHVLIVEDNKTNRKILSKQVYDWGMVPMAATTGREALKYIQRGDDFDIAILDMDLQDMGGLELEEEIRKYNNNLPLVLLISLGKKIPQNHAYLTKPIKPSQLYNILKDVLPKEPANRPIQQGLAGQPTQNHAPRILLAEDNISHQKVAQQMLRKLGYKADIVANGMEVLHSLERQHYDIVFMDVKMPVMDGLEATRIIRQRWPNGPKIIAITAFALEGDREKFIAAGMDDYISKPIQKEDLAQALKRYHLNDQ